MADPFERLKVALAGRYRVERELGAGGMATVYLAHDLRHERQVAIKVLRPELASSIGPDRFLREIQITAKLHHPHILPLLDSGDAGGFLFYVMPLVQGESLRERLNREKQLPVDDAVKIIREVADALNSAHNRDVIHRDIKPENILLEEGHAIVSDFGIARAVQSAGGDKLTETGLSVGTPAYMSPEQASATTDLDSRSDIYSLGCVMYEMIAGETPYTGPTAQAIITKSMVDPVPSVRRVRQAISPAIDAAVTKALAKVPADRFASSTKFAEALSAPVTPGVMQPAAKRVLLAVAAGIAVVLAAVFVLGRASSSRIGSTDAEIEARWMIVAEIEGSAESTIRSAVRDLLRTALDQSPAVRTLAAGDISRGLRIAGKPDTARLTEELALELAVRGQIPAVLAGEVNRVGSTYALSFRVVSPDSGTAVATHAVAHGDNAVIATVSAAATELVRGLESEPDALGPIRPLTEVMTPSMAALQMYRAGRLREAVALDSTFSQAWGRMAIRLTNSGLYDSAKMAIAKAFSHPERMTAYERFRTEAFIRFAEHDYPAAYELFRDAWEAAGKGRTGAVNLGVILWYMGQYERAREAYQFTKAAPFGRSLINIENELTSLLVLGQFEEAHQVLDELADAYPRALPPRAMKFHIARGDWAQADSIAVLLIGDPTTQPGVRLAAIAVDASVLAARGKVRAAVARLRNGREVAADLNVENLGVTDFTQRLHLLSVLTGWPHADVEHDTANVKGLLEASLDAALEGNAPEARRYLGMLRDLPHETVAPLGSSPAVVEAVLAASAGAWDSVIETLTPMETWTWPHRLRRGPMLSSFVLSLLAQAHEAIGQLDTAAIYYHKLASPEESFRRYDDYAPGLTFSFAHRHLALINTKLEEFDRAEQQWLIFLEHFTDPDPELLWMVDEGRAALKRLGRGG